MSEPGAGEGPRAGTSGNDFRGPAAAQTGQFNTQVNHYAEPRSKLWLAVTGAAAVVVTVGAVVLMLKLGDDDGNRDGASPNSAVPPGTSPSVTAPVSPSAQAGGGAGAAGAGGVGSSPSGAVSPTEDAVQWTGTVRLAEQGPKLDAVPPTMERYTRDVRLGLVSKPPRLSGSDSLDNETNLAVWQGRGKPSRKECADLVSTQGMKFAEVSKGTVLCVRTNGGRMAALTVTATSESFTTGVMADAVVWSETASGGR
ncbi:hypothetical protein [Streptomyces sp. NPDC053048]|uniref:hypothetical protein n=1 Tax=Streptomyces sp. NPDC053048 TaxID=3365694 RepID=UPI0037D61C87